MKTIEQQIDEHILTMENESVSLSIAKILKNKHKQVTRERVYFDLLNDNVDIINT